MGWKSTIRIPRRMVISEILSRVTEASDKDLEDVLEILHGNYAGFNYDIVSEETFQEELKRMDELYND